MFLLIAPLIAVNKWLFNQDTVDKVLKHLMTHGTYVEDGEVLGKTIIFAKNSPHAQFIAQRFDANYPHLKGKFARVIDYKTEYAQSLIDDFSEPEKAPHIAVSVDMLDTGIDVPEVVNLVFFKVVRSKTKFWQMIGRGTRLRPDLFGPGQHKQNFQIFDYCHNFEFFNQNPDLSDGAGSESLSQRLFEARVELMSNLDGNSQLTDDAAQKLRHEISRHLYDEVMGMNLDNFVVRPQRRYVEKYQDENIWNKLGLDEKTELIEYLSDLPSSVVDDDTAAKQFDLLILRSQLALLNGEKSFLSYKKKVIKTASALEELQNVPMVAREMELILDVQTDEFWTDITLPMLDTRMRLGISGYNLPEGIRQIWDDEEGDKIENHLPEIAAELIVAGEVFYRATKLHRHEWRVKRKAELEKKEQERIEEEARKTEERRIRNEQAQIDNLLAQASALKQATEIRTYVQVILEANKNAPDPMSDAKLKAWQEWALAQADRIDPVKSGAYKTFPETEK